MIPRTRWCVRILGTAVAALAVAQGGRALADDVPRAAGIFEKETLIYLEVARPGALLDRLGDERLAVLASAIPGPQREKAEEGLKTLRRVVDHVAKRLGRDPGELARSLVGGGIAAAVEGKDRLVVVVEPEDAELLEEAHEALVELARDDAKARGNPDPIKTAEHRGVTAYSADGKEAHAIVDGLLVVASGGEVLKSVIDRLEDGVESSLAEDETWRERRAAHLDGEAAAWAFARLEGLRKADPARYGSDKPADPGQVILFGPWIAALREGDWASAGLTWTDQRLALSLALATPEEGFAETYGGFLPPEGAGAAPRLEPEGMVASLSLWRDLSALWRARAELLPPEAVAGLAQLDGTAGTFFGGRDFGAVLAEFATDWRLVVAGQDHEAMDPKPGVKLPAFALVAGLKGHDEDFAQRLKVAFQSFVGLANLGAAQTKAPPLELKSAEVDGVTIATTAFMKPATGTPDGEPAHYRHNFSPSLAVVGDHVVLSSSLGLARSLIALLDDEAATGGPAEATLAAEVDGDAVAALLDANRERLVQQNQLDKGNDEAAADAEVDLLVGLVRYLGHARLDVDETDRAVEFRLRFDLGSPSR